MSNRLPRARRSRTPSRRLAARPLGDDRAHDRERRSDAQPAEDRRQGARDLDAQEPLERSGAERAAHLEQAAVDLADADHRRHGDREEDDERAHDDLREEAGPEPEREQRGEGEDRRRLGGDDVGRQDPLGEARTGEQVAE